MRTNIIFTALASVLSAIIAIKTMNAPTLPSECPLLRQNQTLAPAPATSKNHIPTIKVIPIRKESKPPQKLGLLEIAEKLEEK